MGPPATPILSALGDTVNVAARLEAETKRRRCVVVISSACARAAGVDLSRFPEHTVTVRGRSEPVTYYAIAGSGGSRHVARDGGKRAGEMRHGRHRSTVDASRWIGIAMMREEHYRNKLRHRARGVADLDRSVGRRVDRDRRASGATGRRASSGTGMRLRHCAARIARALRAAGGTARPQSRCTGTAMPTSCCATPASAACSAAPAGCRRLCRRSPTAISQPDCHSRTISFDLVYSQVAWLYFGNKIGVVREVMRVLRNGGRRENRCRRVPPGTARSNTRASWRSGRTARWLPFGEYLRRYGIAFARAPDGEYLRFGKTPIVRRRPRTGARDRREHAPRALGRHQVRVSRAACAGSARAARSACNSRSRKVIRLLASKLAEFGVARHPRPPAPARVPLRTRAAAQAKQLVEIVERRRRPRARIAVVMPQQHLQRDLDARLAVAKIERQMQRVRRQRFHAVRREVAQVQHVARSHRRSRLPPVPSARASRSARLTRRGAWRRWRLQRFSPAMWMTSTSSVSR